MEKDINKFIVLGIGSLVVADLMTHGSVVTALTTTIADFLSTFVKFAGTGKASG